MRFYPRSFLLSVTPKKTIERLCRSFPSLRVLRGDISNESAFHRKCRIWEESCFSMRLFTIARRVGDRAVETTDLVRPLPCRSSSEFNEQISVRATRTGRENNKRYKVLISRVRTAEKTVLSAEARVRQRTFSYFIIDSVGDRSASYSPQHSGRLLEHEKSSTQTVFQIQLQGSAGAPSACLATSEAFPDVSVLSQRQEGSRLRSLRARRSYFARITN